MDGGPSKVEFKKSTVNTGRDDVSPINHAPLASSFCAHDPRHFFK